MKCNELLTMASEKEITIDKFLEGVKQRWMNRTKMYLKEEFKEVSHLLDICEASWMDIQHPTVSMDYNGDSIDIDEDIAELIGLIWKSGIATYMSCQDNVPKGYIWIMFATAEDMRKFYSVVFDDMTGGEVYKRAFAGMVRKNGNWLKDIYLKEEDGEMIMRCSVRFPIGDYEFVMGRLRDTVEKN